MPKKVWDIIPPKDFKEIDNFKSVNDKKEKIKFSPIKFRWGPFLFFMVLVAGLFVTFKMSKSEINIWPTTKTVNLSSSFRVVVDALSVDYSESVIPGQVFEEEKIVSEDFPSTGSVLQKAEGVIRLYNAYTTMSEVWLAGTRFVSGDGMFFKSKDGISVPGAKIQDGEKIPSYVDVPVIAAEAGEEYNIDPSSFSIYVYRGTDKYTKFYGVSSEDMRGGGELAQITENDLKSAESVLIEKTKEEVEEALKNKITDDFVVLSDVFDTDILESFSSKEVGEVLSDFSFTVRGGSKTISFKTIDVKNLIESFIFSQISTGEGIYSENLNINYQLDSVDWDNGELAISFDIVFETYPEIDLDFLKEELKDKSSSETKFLLENQSEITKTEIKFWPFWVKNIPGDKSRIEINYPAIN